MLSLRIENLRSLADTGTIEVRPLTLLVGRNSSGKSTFLRTFPLLRQSVQVPTRSPVLWFGDYVDFGDFGDALHKTATDEAISFSFGVRVAPQTHSRIRNASLLAVSRKLLEPVDATVRISLRQHSRSAATYLAELALTVGNDEIRIKANHEGKVESLKVGQLDMPVPERIVLKRSDGLLPYLGLRGRDAGPMEQLGLFFPSREGLWEFDRFYSELLLRYLDKYIHASTGAESRSGIARSLKFAEPGPFFTHFRSVGGNLSYFKKATQNLEVGSSDLESIRRTVLVRALPDLLGSIDHHLRAFLLGVRYQAPTRATAERYYRSSGLAIDQVDFQGRNVAMFLRNLTDTERASFTKWSRESFGFSVSTSVGGGHVSVVVKDAETGAGFNLADVGFGYSQLLPLMLQLWSALDRPRQTNSYRPSTLLAFEQPELHLHPSLQAQVGRAFAAAIASDSARANNVQIVAETHSEALVNAVGMMISKGELDPGLVQILTFERRDPSKATLGVSTFDENGFLKNWPFGFFQP